LSINSDWEISKIQSYITNEIEENSKLEYKGPGALQKTEGKKRDITKDISSMANAGGGIVIYGIDEFDEPSISHFPRRISPIKRSEYSREWLDQVISNINPPIKNCLIYPVSIGSDPEDVVYVVEVPQSTTAHQAKDGRYYRRRNTTIEILEHYEIVDIMNRRTHPDVHVEFSWKYAVGRTADLHIYDLIIKINNSGPLVEHFQLDFLFNFVGEFSYNNRLPDIDSEAGIRKYSSKRVIINSVNVLFPNQIVELTELHRIRYKVDSTVYHSYTDNSPIIHWTLYADQMLPKTGIVEFQNLNNF
jgi:hypothetical protein